MDELDSAGGPGRAPNRQSRRSGIFAAGAVFGLVLGGLGIAGAQTPGGSSTTAPGFAPAAGEAGHRSGGPGHKGFGGPHLAAAAKAIGISEADLVTALRSGQSIAQVAQSKNVAVQKVIDAMVAEARVGLVAAITEQVNHAGPFAAARGPHDGGRGRGGPLAHHLGAAAQAIGVSEADLMTAIRSGQSIAQVAQSKNVAVQKVIDALVADARSDLAAKVTAGKLTQAQADEKAADLVAKVTALVNRTGPGR
ncbi:MAG: hypothetical protein ABIW46_01420 [Acidimicrobiales bacterium]